MLKQQKHTYSKNLTTLTKQGLYDPTFEHDACGVGLVANIDGTKSHILDGFFHRSLSI